MPLTSDQLKNLADAYQNTVRFDELVGKRMLSGVDFGYDNCANEDGDKYKVNYMMFRIDDVSIWVQEDYSDGYRSCVKYVRVINSMPKNSFEPQPVTCYVLKSGVLSNGDWDAYDKHCIFVCEDKATGERVIEVGTACIYGYYPCYVANFMPENMAINRAR